MPRFLHVNGTRIFINGGLSKEWPWKSGLAPSPLVVFASMAVFILSLMTTFCCVFITVMDIGFQHEIIHSFIEVLLPVRKDGSRAHFVNWRWKFWQSLCWILVCLVFTLFFTPSTTSSKVPD